MTKNIVRASAVVSALAVALSAAPAFATHWNWGEDITVSNTNDAYVKNDVDVSASTGGNDANGGCGFGNDGGWIETGDAGALAEVYNAVNTNDTKIKVSCDCESDVDDVTVTNNNNARVKNYVDVSAKTGWNNANGGGGFGNDGGTIHTGDAGAAGYVANYVNTNITRIRR